MPSLCFSSWGLKVRKEGAQSCFTLELGRKRKNGGVQVNGRHWECLVCPQAAQGSCAG